MRSGIASLLPLRVVVNQWEALKNEALDPPNENHAVEFFKVKRDQLRSILDELSKATPSLSGQQKNDVDDITAAIERRIAEIDSKMTLAANEAAMKAAQRPPSGRPLASRPIAINNGTGTGVASSGAMRMASHHFRSPTPTGAGEFIGSLGSPYVEPSPFLTRQGSRGAYPGDDDTIPHSFPDGQFGTFMPHWPMEEKTEIRPHSVRERISDRYRITRTLRHTLQGKLAHAVSRESGRSVALKLSSNAAMDDRLSLMGESILEDPINESILLKELSTPGHPHVIKLLDVVQDSEYHGMVLEFAERGEFFDIVSQAGRLDEEVAQKYFHQLMLGVKYIHEREICHLDLSLENLLMDSDGNLKICDFGLARRFKQGEMFPPAIEARPGKTNYMAPEIYDGTQFSGPEADIYSCGVVLFMMLLGCPPYEVPNISDRRFRLIYQNRIKDLLDRWNVSALVSSQALDLLSGMLADRARRLDLEAVLLHPWLDDSML